MSDKASGARGGIQAQAVRSRFLQPLVAEQRALTAWLSNEALPLWADLGVDRGNGGFYERVTQDGRVIDDPRRARLVARQIFVFATAAELGCGDVEIASELVDHGLDFLLTKCITDSGLANAVVSPAGDPVEPGFDLYDHAFCLLALGVSARLGHRRLTAADAGIRMLRAMVELRKHPQAGFEESVPPSKHLSANPHMHLLEAFLGWENSSIDGPWRAFSDEIVELSLEHFVDSRTGGLREHYDHHWRPAPGEQGRLLEPGHHFEWAWLLWRWGCSRARADAISVARRLVSVGEAKGINPLTRLAVNELWDDFSVRNSDSRLWPQTERIKAQIAMAELARDRDELDRAMELMLEAVVGLRRYFVTDIGGLWHETLNAQGDIVAAPAKASSLYHIVCAIHQLDWFVNRYV